MPALCVSVNGQHLATVAFDDNTMIAVNLFGSRSHEEFAVLDMHGGRYGEGQPRHLIWIAERLNIRIVAEGVESEEQAGSARPRLAAAAASSRLRRQSPNK